MKHLDIELTKRLFYISIPIMLQNLLNTSLSFVDTLMIGSLGKEAIAAVGVANQMFFITALFFFGISSGSAVLLSQYYGAKDYDGMKRTASFALIIALVGSSLLVAVSLFFPKAIIRIFSSDPLVIAPGVEYLKTVAFSYFFSALTYVLAAGFRSSNKAYIPLIVSVLSLSLNAFGNWLLIFGIGPFDAMGVKGAALATLISRMVEGTILLILTYALKTPFRFTKKSFSFPAAFTRKYIKNALPVLLNEIFWAVGMVLYKVAYSSLGTDALAIVNISEGIADFFFVAALGVGNGAAILLGNLLGSGEKERAISFGYQLAVISLLIGLIMGTLEFFMAPLFTSWFKVEDSIKDVAIKCIRVNALLQPIKTLNNTIIIGILRGGADTRYSLISEMSCVYLIGVPLAFIGASALNLSLSAVYLIVGLEEVGKLVLGLIRLFSKKWANIVTDASPA